MQKAIQEAKNMIKDVSAQYAFPSSMHFEDKIRIEALNELIERLENLPEDDGWISVRERLPEDDGEYLVVHEPGYQCIRSFSAETNDWYFESFDAKYSVTHWKQLPLPPKN